MQTLIYKLEQAIPILEFGEGSIWWQDGSHPNYDRRLAEDALGNTVRPAYPDCRWADRWSQRSRTYDSPPDFLNFAPGQPAPQWDRNNIVIAMGLPGRSDYKGYEEFNYGPKDTVIRKKQLVLA